MNISLFKIQVNIQPQYTISKLDLKFKGVDGLLYADFEKLD